jgi:type IX secretion system PorP/SprF family membrane protein
MYGQQEPVYTNYRFNSFMLNPSAAGMEGRWAARASYRSEWTRFPGAPITTTISMDGVLGNRSGVGINFISDVIGPEQTWGFQGAYAYHIPMNSSNLALGLGVRALNHSLDPARTVTLQQPDPVVMFQQEWLTDFSFGAFLYNRKYYVGVSAPQIVQIVGKEAKELVPHIYAMGGYKFKVGGTSIIEPSVLLKYADKFQFDIDVQAWFLDEQLMFGAGYRDQSFISIMTGFDVKDRYEFSYSYDFSLSDFQAYSWGSHEVTFGIRFGKQKFNHLAAHKLEKKKAEEEMPEENMESEDM